MSFASAGLVWERFGKTYIKGKLRKWKFDFDNKLLNQLWRHLDKEVFEGIDAHDTGELYPVHTATHRESNEKVNIHTLSVFIAQLNPSLDSSGRQPDEVFAFAVNMIGEFLSSKLENVCSIYINAKVIADLYAEGGEEILYLPKKMEWRPVLRNVPTFADIKYVVVFDGEVYRTYPVQGYRGSKYLFPSNWRGRKGSSLKEATNLSSAKECHKAGFILVTEDKEDALAAAKIALELTKC